MNFLKFYLFTSIIVGLLQVVDGLILVSNSNIGTFNTVFALFEMLWVPVSFIAIFKLSVSKYLPITYLVYNILGWLYGSLLLNNSLGPKLDSIPLWFAVFGICFGIYFAMFSFVSLKQYGVKFVYETY